MKKGFITILSSLVLVLFVFVVSAHAAEPTIKPCDVVVCVEKTENKVATYKGIKVKTRDKDDEFFAFNHFISLDDLTALGKKMGGKTVKYDAKAKTLVVGKKTLEVVPVKVTKDMDILFDKVRKVDYKGKPYFDLWNLSGGLGYGAVSKLSDGVLFSSPLK